MQVFSAGPDFVLGNADDLPVTLGPVNFIALTNTAVANFAAPLPNGVYRGTVATTAMDAAGNPLAQSYTWDFAILPGGPDADPDNDGLTNAEEIAAHTSVSKPDTDGDGWPDGVEVTDGSDPLNPASRPRLTVFAGPSVAVSVSDVSAGTSGTTYLASPAVAIAIADASGSGTAGTVFATPQIALSIADASGSGSAGTVFATPQIALSIADASGSGSEKKGPKP